MQINAIQNQHLVLLKPHVLRLPEKESPFNAQLSKPVINAYPHLSVVQKIDMASAYLDTILSHFKRHKNKSVYNRTGYRQLLIGLFQNHNTETQSTFREYIVALFKLNKERWPKRSNPALLRQSLLLLFKQSSYQRKMNKMKTINSYLNEIELILR